MLDAGPIPSGSTGDGPDDHALVAAARRIGVDVAAVHADDVDHHGRFPVEAIAAVRAAGLLGALLPVQHGGAEATLAEVAQAVTALAEHCAATALTVAMHSIQVACIARHGHPVLLERIAPGLVAGELLLANANSEVGLNGERRTSICALEPTADGFRLTKQASTVSYGEHADGVLATARRHPDSPAADQVMAVCLPPTMSLEPCGEWDTLGLRGTCSRPALLSATIEPEFVIDNYADVFVQTSLPVSAILLSSVWLGLAEGAASRAHAAVRDQARAARRADPDAPAPTSALRLAEATVCLHQIRSMVAHGAAEYERCKDGPEVATLRFASMMDSVKIATSTLAPDVVRRAMAICGLAGYGNASPRSLARISRDIAAAPLMVGNDRALLASAQALLIRKEL